MVPQGNQQIVGHPAGPGEAVDQDRDAVGHVTNRRQAVWINLDWSFQTGKIKCHLPQIGSHCQGRSCYCGDVIGPPAGSYLG